MANFPALQDVRLDPVNDRQVLGNLYDVAAPSGVEVLDPFQFFDNHVQDADTFTRDKVDPPATRNFDAELLDQDLGDFWFEIIHVFPTRFDLGNILSTVVDTITIYNADRFSSHTLDSFNNLAGDGVTVDLPGLPVTYLAQTGATYTLTVTTNGPPTIDGSLDFVFDVQTSQVFITGSRVVMFPYRPEAPLTERLRFLTEVLDHKDGTEQRVSLRVFPRQEFELEIFREEGPELESFDNLIYDWHSRIFGVPVWAEPTVTTAAVSNGDTVVPVRTTANADWRVGGLGIVYQDENVFDALEVTAVGASSVTFASPLGNDYAIGTEVMPLRIARVMDERIDADRAPVGFGSRKIRFGVTDNNVGESFGDDTPFLLDDVDHPLDGLRVLDEVNAIDGRRMRETFERNLLIFDNDTGVVSQTSTWDRGKRSHAKGFHSRTRQRLWEVRKLLHALRGRQATFWLQTFYKNFEPVDTLLQGTTVMTVTEVGYARFVQSRDNRNIIYLRDNQGRVQSRTITGATSLGDGTEQITVDSGWEFTLTPGEIERISTYAEVRLATDDVEIEHLDSAGQAKIFLPVTEVF